MAVAGCDVATDALMLPWGGKAASPAGLILGLCYSLEYHMLVHIPNAALRHTHTCDIGLTSIAPGAVGLSVVG